MADRADPPVQPLELPIHVSADPAVDVCSPILVECISKYSHQFPISSSERLKFTVLLPELRLREHGGGEDAVGNPLPMHIPLIVCRVCPSPRWRQTRIFHCSPFRCLSPLIPTQLHNTLPVHETGRSTAPRRRGLARGRDVATVVRSSGSFLHSRTPFVRGR